MVFDWIFGALKPKCVTCKKLLKDKWFEFYVKFFLYWFSHSLVNLISKVRFEAKFF